MEDSETQSLEDPFKCWSRQTGVDMLTVLLIERQQYVVFAGCWPPTLHDAYWNRIRSLNTHSEQLDEASDIASGSVVMTGLRTESMFRLLGDILRRREKSSGSDSIWEETSETMMLDWALGVHGAVMTVVQRGV